MKFFIVLKILKLFFLNVYIIFYMEVILINKKRFKKKKIIDIILKVVESINFLIMFWFFLF